MTLPTLAQAQQDSHDLRQMYERWSFIIVPSVVVLIILVALVAALWPTEYGQMVVTRIISLKDIIMDLLGVVVVFAGGSMARGHFDARLNAQSNGAPDGNNS